MELLRTLAALAERPTKHTARLAEALGWEGPPTPEEHTEVFVMQLYPYASVYLGAEGMLGGDARDRIAGFWRALGEVPPAEPDHLTVLLALYARLVELEHDEGAAVRKSAWRCARAVLLWEHLLSWLFPYLDGMAGTASPRYVQWAELLRQALVVEAATLPSPGQLSRHLSSTPPLGAPGEGEPAEFLAFLLAPMRSGMIVTRNDVARLARDTGLALRAGERRFALEMLLQQDARAVWGWLRAEAVAWQERHRRWRDVAPDISRFWVSRAGGATDILDVMHTGMEATHA